MIKMVEKTVKWKKALDEFLRSSYDSLVEEKQEWAIIGSIATKLQGCNLIPNDVDILVKEPKTVHFISNLMKDFHEEKRQGSFLNETQDNLWLSSKEQPVEESKDEWGFDWVFARWIIYETRVEVAHITAPEEQHKMISNGIWEAGPKIWAHIKKIDFKKHQIPVVPLEIQLETSMNRCIEDRVSQIIAIFRKNGYDKKLLKNALNAKNSQKIKEQLEKENK